MATLEECRQALQGLATRLAESSEARGKLDFDRTLACRFTDLGAAIHARLTGGQLVDVSEGDDPKAKIALSSTSDDFLALVAGRLDVTRAIASRQVSIRANPFDLLKLRRLF